MESLGFIHTWSTSPAANCLSPCWAPFSAELVIAGRLRSIWLSSGCMSADRYASCCASGRSSPPSRRPAASCAYSLSSVVLDMPAKSYPKPQIKP